MPSTVATEHAAAATANDAAAVVQRPLQQLARRADPSTAPQGARPNPALSCTRHAVHEGGRQGTNPNVALRRRIS